MNREHHIDGLRGLAALIVVVSHFLCAFYPATDTLLMKDMKVSSLEVVFSTTPLNILYNGNFAVCIFFVISGYVLSASFFASKNTDVVYSSAYRRYFRLMIPVLVTSVFYYLFLAQGWLLSKHIPEIADSPWMQKMWNFEPGLGHFFKSTLYDLVIHQDIEPPYNPALWSIGIELKGSYLVYGFLLLMGNYRFRWLGYLVLMILTLKSYYFLFVTGMLLSDVQHQAKVYEPRSWQFIPLLVVACYFGSYKYTESTNLWRLLDYLRGIIKPQAIGAICLFYVCIHSRWAFTFLSTRVANFLGEISYSLYLVHLLVIGSVSGIVFYLFSSQLSFNYVAASGATFLITIGVSFLLAKVCTKWVDDKGVAFAKWVYAVIFR
ncbi:MAG: acyltransferase [Bacteroidota bacterium]